MTAKYPARTPSKYQGNIRFTQVKEEKHYVAYSTVFLGPKDVVGTLMPGWYAIPHTYDETEKSYTPDNNGKIRGKSRPEAVEKLFLKNFNMPEDGISHRRMQCIDHLS